MVAESADVAPVANAFGSLLTEIVDRATGPGGKLKKEIAHDCGIRPDYLAHLLSNRRRPRNPETVLQIARGLGLDGQATERLLEAAGFGRTLVAPDRRAQMSTLVSRLVEPERAIAEREVENDIQLIRHAWEHYVSAESHNLARTWGNARDLFNRGEEQYWALRAAAARLLAQVHLAAATSRQYLNELDEAERICREGLEAAVSAGSNWLQVMLLARLADIVRLKSDSNQASAHCAEALALLNDWDAKDRKADPAIRAWRDHWKARILRKQGTLDLYMGEPKEARDKLLQCYRHFLKTNHHHELAQICYALGWAESQLGRWDDAAAQYRDGLRHAQNDSAERGHDDHRSLMQGHLYLSIVYLDMDNLEGARAELEEAGQVANKGKLERYQEVGRVELHWAKLLMKEKRGKEVVWEEVQRHLDIASKFFSERQDRLRLADVQLALGDFHWKRGGNSHYAQRALHHYKAAYDLTSIKPVNPYYQCAALIRISRVCVQTQPRGPEFRARPEGDAESVTEWAPESLIEAVKKIAETHHYRNLQARAFMQEAEWAKRQHEKVPMRMASRAALVLSRNFNVYLHNQIRKRVGLLGLDPDRLIAEPPPINDGRLLLRTAFPGADSVDSEHFLQSLRPVSGEER